MTNKKLHRINTKRFTENLCKVADNYGHKTVGSLYKAAKKAGINTKWYIGTIHVRNSRILKELEWYLKS